MKRFKWLAAALVLLLPVMGHGAETAAKPPVPSLPKGHPALPPPQKSAAISGKVLKTMDSGGYTYIRLQKEGGKKIWIAVPKTKIVVGKQASFFSGAEMKNFKSKTLNRTFDSIIFSAGIVSSKGGKNARKEAVVTPGSKGAMVAADKVKVAKAAGPDARTVAELFALKGSLAGKKVVVRGKVVKVSERIMKMNWLHIQDGSGSPNGKDHDLVVTTKALPAEGETVTVSGTLLKDKDYGYGYKYDVIVDNAEITR